MNDLRSSKQDERMEEMLEMLESMEKELTQKDSIIRQKDSEIRTLQGQLNESLNLCENDDIYYPDLQLPEGTNYNIGKFGHMRCEYLKEFKHGYYMELLLEEKLNEYLHEIDEECYEMMDRLVEQMKEKQGVTEKLKAENQMLWGKDE